MVLVRSCPRPPRKVIIVGGNPDAVRRLGFRSATTLNDAFEIATDVVGPQPTITHFKSSPNTHGQCPIRKNDASETYPQEIRRRTKQIRHAIDGTRRRLINLKFIRTAQFPYRPPSVPKGVDPLPKQSKQAVHSKQAWAKNTCFNSADDL